MSLVDTVPTGRGAKTTPTASRSAAAIVIAAPLLVLVSELVAPRETPDQSAAEDAKFMLDHADRLAASWGIGLLAAAALAAAYLLLVHRFDGRGTPARVAAVLGVLGSIGLAGHMAVSLAVRDILLADPSAVAAAEDAFSGLSAVLTIIPVIVGLNIAVLLLSIAMYRAGWAGWWVIVVGALALVADFGPTSYNTVAHAVLALGVFGVAAAEVARPGH